MPNQGNRMYGTTTSNNHIVGPNSGARFTYVHTIHDGPNSIDVENIAVNAKRVHMVMSNGPFMKIDIKDYLSEIKLKVTEA